MQALSMMRKNFAEFFWQLILTCHGNIIENPLTCMYNYKRHRCFLNDRRSDMVLQRERRTLMYTYDIEWTVNDDGAQNRRIILHFPQKVKMADVSGNKFSVYVERKNKKGEIM